jgi:Ser/Thr protein kinase RdoA (MazF antagonist)
MPLFNKTVEVSRDQVASALKQHWDLQLGDLIKASQNHTFRATADAAEGGRKFSVRVTPDADGVQEDRIRQEIAFVSFISEDESLSNSICAPIATLNGDLLVRDGDLVIVVFSWARGDPLDFMAYRWMKDERLVYDWGRWLALFHQASRRFSSQHPDIAAKVQKWDEVHDGIMKGCALNDADVSVMDDSEHFGVIHGDLNLSNFFYDDSTHSLSVYDWDQTQAGWFLWDMAQSMITVNMLAEAGSVIDGSPVPDADPVRFEAWMVVGYESVMGAGSVDLARLKRMLILRKSFYERFCRRAVEEGDVPKDMDHFIRYVVAWFDKHPLALEG